MICVTKRKATVVPLLRKLRIRSAYNRGDYETAKNRAQSLLNHHTEGEFAKDIVLRSLYNLGHYEEVIRFGDMWSLNTASCVKKSERILWLNNPEKAPLPSEILELREQQPMPTQQIEWNSTDVVANFLQEGHRVWFQTPLFCVYWDTPEGFCLKNTHAALLHLIAEILLPHERSLREQVYPTRLRGHRLSLSFSAGTDSTAAALLMPKNTILAYHRRSFESLLDHRNADTLLKKLGEDNERTVVSISSNHELLRTFRNKPIGFSSDFACATHLILLADYYDLSGIAFGMPVDNTYLWKGRRFRDYSNLPIYTKWVERFKLAGLDYLLPISSISEAGAMKICELSEYAPFVNSCMRGDGRSGCGRCWKCFHKNGPMGRPVDLDAREIRTYLAKRPFPTSTHALWALQHYGREDMLPDLQHLFGMDYTWWEGYYPPGFMLLPPSLREHVQPQIERLLKPMPIPYALETLDHFDEGNGE